MVERIVAISILVLIAAAVAAWFFNQVGGAGFWYNLKNNLTFLVQLTAFITAVAFVIYLVAVAIFGSWTPL